MSASASLNKVSAATQPTMLTDAWPGENAFLHSLVVRCIPKKKPSSLDGNKFLVPKAGQIELNMDVEQIEALLDMPPQAAESSALPSYAQFSSNSSQRFKVNKPVKLKKQSKHVSLDLMTAPNQAKITSRHSQFSRQSTIRNSTADSNALPERIDPFLSEDNLFQKAVEEFLFAHQGPSDSAIPFSRRKKTARRLDLQAFIIKKKQESTGFLPSLASFRLRDYVYRGPVDGLDVETVTALAQRQRFGPRLRLPALDVYGLHCPFQHYDQAKTGQFNLREPDWIDLKLALSKLELQERTFGVEIKDFLAQEVVREERKKQIWREKISSKFKTVQEGIKNQMAQK